MLGKEDKIKSHTIIMNIIHVNMGYLNYGPPIPLNIDYLVYPN